MNAGRGALPPPDDPRRRLWWELPLAAALLIAVWWALTLYLHQAAHSPPPQPVEAQIYELPPAQAAAPARPAAPSASARPPVGETSPQPAPKATPAPKTVPAPKTGRRADWAALSAQMNSLASSLMSHSQFAQTHDPHTLVARYYLAAVLEKLQRVGDMIYTGQQVGTVDVRLIIGPDGTVRVLELNPRAGALGLEAVARQIVDLAAPFAPFPQSLRRQTPQLKLTIHMDFLGYREVAPSY